MLRFKTDKPVELANEAFWLAWKTSQVTGMGVFQDRPSATKKNVCDSLTKRSDYRSTPDDLKENFYADYVFGRMMKMGVTCGNDYVEVSSDPLRRDYESWCGKYPDYETLLLAAAASLGVKVEKTSVPVVS